MIKKKLVLLIVQFIALVLCISFATFAWFSNNKQIKSSNKAMTIQAVSDVTTLSCYALRYDGTYGAICYSIGDGEGQVTDVEMTEFDRIFRDRAVNTPLIYAVELGNVPDTEGYYIYVKVPCTEKFINIGNNTTTNNHTDDGTPFIIQRYISNVISVKVNCGASISPLTATTTNRDQNNIDVFQAQNTAFKSITSGDKVGEFASVTNNDTVFSKDTYVEVKLSQLEYHQYIYPGTNEQGQSENRLMLYIQFDYDDVLMDAYIDQMSEDSDYDINFEDDLGVIQILVGAGGN